MGLRISQRRGRTAVALATWPSPICTLSPGMSPVGIASRSSIAGAVTTSGSERFTSASLTFWTEEHYRTWKVQIVRLEREKWPLGKARAAGQCADPLPSEPGLAKRGGESATGAERADREVRRRLRPSGSALRPVR